MKLQLVIVMALALLVTVISRADKSPTSTHPTTGNVEEHKGQMDKSAFEMGRHYAVITFNRGSNELTVAEKANLRALVEKAKAVGAVERVRVVAWSDKPLPAGKSAADLPKSDRDLATARIDKIEEYLENELGIRDVKSFSMAERANWFARAFNTTEAELKSIFARKSAENEVSQEQLRVIKQRGGPTKAIVIIQDKIAESVDAVEPDTTSGTTTSESSSEEVAPTAEEQAKN